MLKAKNLHFGYTSAEVLKGVDFEANESEIISLIGPNGCGKSTLLRCLSGLLKSSQGSVEINGKNILNLSKNQIAREISFLPQFQEKMSAISVGELVAMGRSVYNKFGWISNKQDREIINWAMDYMKITHLKNRYVNLLSGGERQRVWIAMILAQDTAIILLDEPVTYMDLKHQWNLLDTVNDLKTTYGKTVISVFHDINHAMEISDVIYLMQSGKIYKKGSTSNVITSDSIEEVYEISAHVCFFQECNKNVVVPGGCK